MTLIRTNEAIKITNRNLAYESGDRKKWESKVEDIAAVEKAKITY